MAHTFVVDDKLKRGDWKPPAMVTTKEALTRVLDLAPPDWMRPQEKASFPKKKQLEAWGSSTPDGVMPVDGNVLLAAVNTAYDYHLPLILSPDDVWLAVISSVAKHINSDPERHRHHFVQHEGQVNLEIQRDHFIRGSAMNDWPGCFAEFSTLIRSHIGKKADLLTSSFSTTGLVERAASEVVLMDAMQSFFSYSMRTCCGLTDVTVLGTEADWRDIRARVQTLAELDLGWWVDVLIPVVDQFAAACAGVPDATWWRSFYKEQGVSGGPYITGHINALFPYDRDGKRVAFDAQHRTTDEYPLGLSRVPLTWHYYAETLNYELIAGLVGVNVAEDTKAVRAVAGWAVRERDEVQP